MALCGVIHPAALLAIVALSDGGAPAALILAVVVAVASASAALVAIALLSGAATLAYAATVADRGGDAGTHHARARVLGSVAVRLLVAIAFLLGGVLGGLEVAVPAFAISHHAPAVSGLLVAALSVGGILGAAVYGGRTWAMAPSARLVVLLATLTLAVLLGAAARSAAELGALLLAAGTCLNPVLTTISLLVVASGLAAFVRARGLIASGDQ